MSIVSATVEIDPRTPVILGAVPAADVLEESMDAAPLGVSVIEHAEIVAPQQIRTTHIARISSSNH